MKKHIFWMAFPKRVRNCAALVLAFSASLFGQNMGIKMAPGASPNATLDVNGSFALREGTALALANGQNNNVALDSMSFYRLTGPTAAFAVSGFTGIVAAGSDRTATALA